MPDASTNLQPTHGHDIPPADRRNGRRIVALSLLWTIVFLASSWLLRSDPAPSGAAPWVIAAGTTLLALVPLWAYGKYVRDADELTRLIQLRGVAFGFGTGLLFSLCYPLFEIAGAAELSLADVATVMIFGYIAGVVLATRRYR